MSKATQGKDKMRSHYDFSQAEQGKYQHFIGQTSTLRITHSDGSVSVEQIEPPKDAIFLEPALRKYFPDSEAVNKALRGLIELIPKKSE